MCRFLGGGVEGEIGGVEVRWGDGYVCLVIESSERAGELSLF